MKYDKFMTQIISSMKLTYYFKNVYINLRHRNFSGVLLGSSSQELESRVLMMPRSQSSLSPSLATTDNLLCFVSDSCFGGVSATKRLFFLSDIFGVCMCGRREDRRGVIADITHKFHFKTTQKKSPKFAPAVRAYWSNLMSNSRSI